MKTHVEMLILVTLMACSSAQSPSNQPSGGNGGSPGGTGGNSPGGTGGNSPGGTGGNSPGGTGGSPGPSDGSAGMPNGPDLGSSPPSTGGEIFPPDNPWNTDISQAPVDPNSDAYIASIGASTGLHPDFDSISAGIPYVMVPPNQPMVPITFTLYASESDPGPYPIPDNAPIETGSDQHVLAVDIGNGFLYELNGAMKIANGWSAYNGAVFNLRSNSLRPAGWTSADAAGLPIFPGLVRYDEVSGGAIHHALRFTVRSTQKGYVSPARHSAGSCPINSNCPPMGMRVRLKASVDISPYPAAVQVVLTALRRYGMFVADNGGNWFMTGAPDPNWNDNDMQMLSGIVGSDFEVVSTGPITPGF